MLKLRQAVSKKKRRYVDQDFNLDLVILYRIHIPPFHDFSFLFYFLNFFY